MISLGGECGGVEVWRCGGVEVCACGGAGGECDGRQKSWGERGGLGRGLKKRVRRVKEEG